MSGNERMNDKPLIFDDGGEWQVFDLLKEGCAGVPLVSRSKFRAVSYVDDSLGTDPTKPL